MEFDIKNKLTILSLALWAAAALVAWIFLFGPDLQKLGAANAAKKEDAQKQSVLQTIAQLGNERETYKARLAESGDVSWMIEALTRFSKETDVKILSISPLAAEKVRQYEKISLRLRIECRYHALGNFVSRIENYDKLMKVSEMTVSKKSDGARAGLETALVVSTFRAL